MAVSSARTVLYDISNVIASVRLSATGDAVEALTAYPIIVPHLEAHRRMGERIGILADPARVPPEEFNRALRRAGLLGYFDPLLIFYGSAESLPACADRAAGLVRAAGGPPDLLQPLLVSHDAAKRSLAQENGFLTAPSPVLTGAVLSGRTLCYARVIVPPDRGDLDWRVVLRDLRVVPCLVSEQEGPATAVYAVMDADGGHRLKELGLEVRVLDADPQRSDLYLVTHHEGQVGPPQRLVPRDGELEPAGVLDTTCDGLVVAVPGGAVHEALEALGPGHFHANRLLLSPVLLAPVLRVPSSPLRAVASGPPDGAPPGPSAREEPMVTPAVRRALAQHITPQWVQHEVSRLTGVLPISRGVTIASRDVRHPDNAETVRVLARDFVRMDRRLRVRLHPFTHECVPQGNRIGAGPLSMVSENVEAVLPRSGLSGVVIVSAHLDSIVTRQVADLEEFDPSRDPAPGADDDASGVAGVLCIARALLKLTAANVMHREIRFVLFNAEECSVTGSANYAMDCRNRGDDIVAVFHMDMVGFESIRERIFEVHAGNCGSPETREHSRELAGLVARLGPELSTSVRRLEAQIYPGQDGLWDPADGWSDHSRFHAMEFPACLVSEDFWPDSPENAQPPDVNPQYHSPADRVIDAEYAADIVRAVAAAAWIVATR